MSDDSGEKTEEPTQKKIDDSREKGNVWKSKDLTGVFVFLSGMFALKWSWPWIQGDVTKLFHESFEQLSRPENLHHAVISFVYRGMTAILVLSMPVMLTGLVVGVLLEFLQVGPLLSMEAISPKLEKLNPLAGLKNMVSKKQFIELIKTFLKMTMAVYVVFGVVEDSVRMVMLSIRGDAGLTLKILAEMVYILVIRISLLFIVFAIFDVWFQRRAYFKDLMMTKDEVKREYKQSEGDPHHKAARKQMHQEILESGMMENVKDASAVITNPDHIAIAVRYDPGGESAPRVRWKAQDEDAEALKAFARERGISVLRNVPLAHALLDVELGSEIPEDTYDAVAEILNFVYSLNESALQT